MYITVVIYGMPSCSMYQKQALERHGDDVFVFKLGQFQLVVHAFVGLCVVPHTKGEGLEVSGEHDS